MTKVWLVWEKTDHVDPSVDLPCRMLRLKPQRAIWARVKEVEV
jgi:hypothetical protein